MSHAQQKRRPSTFGRASHDERQNSSISHVYHRNSPIPTPTHRSSECSNFNLPHNHPVSDEFRQRLRVHCMNPLQKWQVKGLIPWKLGLQAVKIFVVTCQLVVCAKMVSQYFLHQNNTLATFKEIFMSVTDLSEETMPYPPVFPAAVHSKDDFYAHLNKAISVYSVITDVSLGLIGYAERVSKDNPISAIEFCKESYAHGTVNPSALFYNFSSSINYECMQIMNVSWPPGDPNWKNFSIEEYLQAGNSAIDFESLLRALIVFPMRTIYVNSMTHDDVPDCFDVNVTITYDNSLHGGRMTIDLTSTSRQMRCRNGIVTRGTRHRKTYEKLALNIIVLIICTTSFIFSILSLYRGNKLRLETLHYFESNLGKELHFSEHFFFFDLWLVITIMNDALTISGTVIKLLLEKRLFESKYFSSCSVLLGLGGFFAWISMLRYLSFFPMYNVLLLTVKRSMPYLLRFSLCIGLLFGGFCICGWLVLSPYHVKFRSFSSTAECLFSLVNGDDMFVTFAALNPRGDLLIWLFSRIYIYVFVCLFIYVVLSLFIAIIMESFDAIQVCYMDGFPLSDLEQFIVQCPMDVPDDASADSRPLNKFKDWLSPCLRT